MDRYYLLLLFIYYRDDGLYFKKIKLPEEIASVEVMLI